MFQCGYRFSNLARRAGRSSNCDGARQKADKGMDEASRLSTPYSMPVKASLSPADTSMPIAYPGASHNQGLFDDDRKNVARAGSHHLSLQILWFAGQWHMTQHCRFQ